MTIQTQLVTVSFTWSKLAPSACLSLVRQGTNHLRPLQVCGSRWKADVWDGYHPDPSAPFSCRCCCPSRVRAPRESAPEPLHFSGWGIKTEPEEPVLTSPITAWQCWLWLQGCKPAFYKTPKFNCKPKFSGLFQKPQMNHKNFLFTFMTHHSLLSF